jgi:hypothetical protein
MDAVSSDKICYMAIVAALDALQQFETLYFGVMPPRNSLVPSSWIQPWKWREDTDDDDEVMTRTVWFRVRLEVSTQDPISDVDPFERVQSLASLVANAFDTVSNPPWFALNSGINEGIYPVDSASSTITKSGSYPTVTLYLIGKFTYEVPRAQRT